MARITKPSLFRFENFKDGTVAAVGHNRAVAHTLNPRSAPKITATLHGHMVFSLEEERGHVVLTISNAGYRTVTTTAAINDFLKAAGIRMGLSQASDKMTLTASGERIYQTDEEAFAVSLDPYTLRYWPADQEEAVA